MSRKKKRRKLRKQGAQKSQAKETPLARRDFGSGRFSQLQIEAVGPDCDIRVLPSGIAGGCVYFILAGGIYFFAVILTLASVAEPHEVVPRYYALGLTLLGTAFTLGGTSISRRRGRVSANADYLEVFESGLFWNRKLSWDARDLTRVAVVPSAVSINGKSILELTVQGTHCEGRFFRHVADSDLHTMAEQICRFTGLEQPA